MTMSKNLILIFIIASFKLIASEVNLPKIDRPLFLAEGTEHQIDAKEIEALLPWAKDSKIVLEKTLSELEFLKSSEKLSFLESQIKKIVLDSSFSRNELKMRYVLNRSLMFGALIKSQTLKNNNNDDTLCDLYILSIKRSLAYLESDLKNKDLIENNYAEFGYEYVMFMFEISKSIVDASAQFHFNKRALEIFQYDLYRDLENKQFATIILDLKNTIESLDDTNGLLSDQFYLSKNRLLIRQYNQAIKSVKITLANIAQNKHLIASNDPQISLGTKLAFGNQNCLFFLSSSGHTFGRISRDCENLNNTQKLRFYNSLPFNECLVTLTAMRNLDFAFNECQSLSDDELKWLFWDEPQYEKCSSNYFTSSPGPYSHVVIQSCIKRYRDAHPKNETP